MGLAKYKEDNEEIFWERIAQKEENEQTEADYNSAAKNTYKNESVFPEKFNGQSCFSL